jgi:protein-S-isoprenylcysteine O-methyltransferase Ste14
MIHSTRAPWWRGKRGEWYVATQVILIGLVFLGPRTLPSLPTWPRPVIKVSVFTGVALMFAGCCLLLASLVRLGSNLTPLPYPKQHATLVQTGPYHVVRHPMYSGGIMLAYGWALAVSGWLTLVYATVLLVFLDIKSDREEQWLTDKFPGYPEYQRRVRKLIPFVY